MFEERLGQFLDYVKGSVVKVKSMRRAYRILGDLSDKTFEASL